MVGQDLGVEITWHAFLGADSRPMLRLPAPKPICTYMYKASIHVSITCLCAWHSRRVNVNVVYQRRVKC